MNRFITIILLFLSTIPAYAGPRKVVRGVRPEEIQPFTEKVAEHLCTRANTVHPLETDAVYWFKDHTVEIYFSQALSEQPLRNADIEWLYATARRMLSSQFPKCSIRIYTDKKPVEQLSSKWFSGQSYSSGIWDTEEGRNALQTRTKEYQKLTKKAPVTSYSFVKSSNSKLDTVKVPYTGHSSGMNGSSTASDGDRQWVRPLSNDGVRITAGLQGRNIALWNSHGLFYNAGKRQWRWQRPHLFQTCEDLLTADITLNYLVPMLENAGAYVTLPKERDTRTEEVIVDDGSKGYSESGAWTDAPFPGFGAGAGMLVEGENPFTRGGARKVASDAGSASAKAFACWKPSLPKAGEYAVYVSYQSLPNSTTASYTVHHCGQKSTFAVNQRMGGGTWVYLGTFFFDDLPGDGRELRNGVTLSNKPASGSTCGKEVITADAVRFGGGLGNVSREGSVSGRPRYMEGARYWLQYAGYPENMYDPFDGGNDYKDDYTSRALWVNALSGGSDVNPLMSGYGVPLDLSFALHTDAGLAKNDSIVGSLAIYTTQSNGRKYLADGRSRFISRELSDIIQTQVVSDVRACFDSTWSRRGMWDKSYFETREPEVPSMILELLSHQNMADMQLAMDPAFKFTVARAIYKGMLTFFKATRGSGRTVQPLPVKSFSAVQSDGRAHLCWEPAEDPLEPSAAPEGYVVYRREIDPSTADDRMLRTPGEYWGFVREGFTRSTEYTSSKTMEEGMIYSYKVVAVNKGGASFPSEILSVSVGERGEALAVNCFDRLSAPESFGLTDTLTGGFTPWKDRGVAYRRDISYAGDQYSFDKRDPYVDDDHPGFGASWSDFDTLIACGNTFDYPLIHCAALSRAGYGFSSCTRDALDEVDTDAYTLIDVIGGKQKRGGRYRTVLTEDVVSMLRRCSDRGGTIVVSGAYLLSDLDENMDEEALQFAEDVLKVRLLSTVSPSGVEGLSPEEDVRSEFSSVPDPSFYTIESADALAGTDRLSKVLLRYSGHGPAACIVYRGRNCCVMTAGFPLESCHHLYTTLKAAL